MVRAVGLARRSEIRSAINTETEGECFAYGCVADRIVWHQPPIRGTVGTILSKRPLGYEYMLLRLLGVYYLANAYKISSTKLVEAVNPHPDPFMAILEQEGVSVKFHDETAAKVALVMKCGQGKQ